MASPAASPVWPFSPEQLKQIAEITAKVTASEVLDVKLAPLFTKLEKMDRCLTEVNTRVALFLGKNGDAGIFQKTTDKLQAELDTLTEKFRACQGEHDTADAVAAATAAEQKGFWSGSWTTVGIVVLVIFNLIQLAAAVVQAVRK